jgi:CubicO group peptidase (beta-lactamase class C family)
MSYDCCNPYVSNASANATYLTNQGFIVSGSGSATASSTYSQEDANTQAFNIANNVAYDSALTIANTINQTIDILNIDNGSFINPESIIQVKKYLQSHNELTGAPYSAYVFGNAFTNQEEFIGVGIGQKYDQSGNIVNTPVNEDMIWRWASFTKLLGTIMIAKAVEDGLIESIDDPVYKYVPEIGDINQYVSGSTYLGTTDNYGTFMYDISINTVPNLGKTITIRHLINSSSGIGYTFWRLGLTRVATLNNQKYTDFETGQVYPPGTPPPNNSSFANFIAYLQYLEKQENINNGSNDIDVFTSYYYGDEITFTDLILNRIKFPLLNPPGTKTNTNYGADLNVLGAVIGGALRNKGILKTASEYCKEKIFDPLEMTNSWLSCGSLPYIEGSQSKIIDCCFYRKLGAFQLPNSFDNQKGTNVSYNTLYVSSDPNVQDDGFVKQINGQLFKTYQGVATNFYSGGFAESGIGPLTDYSKLIKMIINNGIYTNISGENITILKKQSIQYLLTPKANSDLSNPYIGIWSCGAGTTNFVQPYETWGGGFAIADRYKGESLPLGVNPNVQRWMAYYNMHYYFDTVTGNYLLGGVQISNASWFPNNIPVEPDIQKVWQILTLN